MAAAATKRFMPGATLAFFGLMAPKGTPAAITEKIAAEAARAMTAPDVRAKLDALGFQAKTDTPEAFAAYAADCRARGR